MQTPLKISREGVALLKAYETLQLRVYLDQAGRKTIGYGHLIRGREDFLRGIDAVRAEELLASDTGWAEDCVNAWAAAKIELAQHEFDALVCFIFNCGPVAFETSSLRRKLVAGDRAGAAAEFAHWDKAHDGKTGRLFESPGLRKRRAAERALFLGEPWSPP